MPEIESTSIWTLILGSSVIGALVSSLVNHFFSSWQLKKEREFTLNKEIYFNAQKQVSEIMQKIGVYDKTVNRIAGAINNQGFSLEYIKIDCKKERNLMGNIISFFPELTKNCDEFSKAYQNFSDNFYDSVLKNIDSTKTKNETFIKFKISDEQKIIVPDLDKKYWEKRDRFIKSLNQSLENYKKSIT